MESTSRTNTIYTLTFEEADLLILAAYLQNYNSNLTEPKRLREIRQFIWNVVHPARCENNE